MTLATWTKEFYPTKPSKRMSNKAAIQHSLRKWEGLRKSVLKKHGVTLDHDYGWISDNTFDSLYINETTCVLCEKYLDYDAEENLECARCPLGQLLGHSCDFSDKDPYMIWRNTGNPLPMIKALKKIAEEE